MISTNINFHILLCHSPILLFSFLRNSYMHVWILLFPFEFCYSLFWFYYAIMNSFIQFRILLFVFEFWDAVVQFCNLIVQSSEAVLHPVISFPILLFSFQFYYSLSICVLPNLGLQVIHYKYVYRRTSWSSGGWGEAHKMSVMEGGENWSKLGSLGGRVSTLALILEGEKKF